jgi:hypothetical protein
MKGSAYNSRRRTGIKHNRMARLPMEKRAELALQEAVSEVIADHVQLGLPLYIGHEGKVRKLSPETFVVFRGQPTGDRADSPLF